MTSGRSRTTNPPRIARSLAWRHRLARKLLAWYRKHQRTLPWRNSRDPYRVWISEIMLQQTQVVTVIPYFERFIEVFPNVQTLAAADEHEVLRHWEGLGYYRRARQMHRAAQMICADHGGEFPRTLEQVRQLPGVGRYTAGAIVSIAFNQPAPILEANTVRLHSRLLAFRDETTSSAGQRLLWQFAEDLLPTRDCGSFNQALMELGSQVCTPRAPRCDECPLQAECAAYQAGCQDQVPRLKAKVAFEAVHEASVVVYRSGRVLLRRRESGERWAGLWDFLRFAVEPGHTHERIDELLRKTRQHSGLSVGVPSHLVTLKHGVTRFRITLDCFAVNCAQGPAKLIAGEWQWVAPKDLGSFALSVTGRKLARILSEQTKPGKQKA